MALYSAGVEYGIHCLLFLADEKGDSRESSVRTLAELQGVPPELLAKVFTRLAKAGLVAATEGVRGGFPPGTGQRNQRARRGPRHRRRQIDLRMPRGPRRCAIFRQPAFLGDPQHLLDPRGDAHRAEAHEEALAQQTISTWYAGWGVSRHRSSAKKCCAGWMPAGKDAAAPATSPWRIRSGAASPFRGKHHCRLRC